MQNTFLFLFPGKVSKVLVTTGDNTKGNLRTSEIVDLTIKGGNKCQNWPKFPTYAEGAVGGIIENTVIICGGYVGFLDSSYTNECYSLSGWSVELVTHMSVERSFAASIVLHDTTLWITGGSGDFGRLSSSEYITLDGTMPGPTMPIALSYHAMVVINDTYSMIIGGNKYQGVVSSTIYYNHKEKKWINGPNLIQERMKHAAGIVTDEFTRETFVMVTGGIGDNPGPLSSTEFLKDGNWNQGKIREPIHVSICSYSTVVCPYLYG